MKTALIPHDALCIRAARMSGVVKASQRLLRHSAPPPSPGYSLRLAGMTKLKKKICSAIYGKLQGASREVSLFAKRVQLFHVKQNSEIQL